MTAEPPAVAVDVFADLQIDVDGQRATLTGDGRRLTFTTMAPQRLLSALPATGPTSRDGLRLAGRFAELLASQGLELQVVGPHGVIARLGQGNRSWWGPAVFGTRLVGAGSPRSLGSLTASIVRSSRFFRPVVGALTVAAAALLARKGATVISDRH